jgi:flagellar hook-length control protein FliK
MSQTNIDTLFQAIAAGTDRKLSTARTGGDTAGFDDHLNQASTTVFDVARPASHSDSASIYSSSDSTLPRVNSQLPSSQAPDGTDESKTPICPPAPPTREHTSEADTSPSETDADEDARDTADDAVTAVAGAVEAAVANAAEEPEQVADNADHDGRVRAKEAIAANEKSKPQPKGGTKSDIAPARSEVKTGTVDAESFVAEGENPAATGPTDVAASEEEQVEEVAPTTKPTKKGDRSAGANKTISEHESASGDDQSTPPASAAKTVGLGMINGEQAVAPSKAETVANVVPSNKTAESEFSSHEDSHQDSKGAARANSQAVAAAIVNGVATNIVDNAANGNTPKEISDKPAKSELVKTDSFIGTLGRASRAAADIARGTQETNVNDVPRIDPSRFVGRVAKAFQTANERGGTLQLRLSPPELGALRIQLTVKDGVMSAALETDNAGARRVLLDHLPALRDRLAEQNIRVERFDVDVRQENNGGQANPHGSNQNPYQQQPDRSESRMMRPQQRVSESVLPELPAAPPQISSTGINLFV